MRAVAQGPRNSLTDVPGVRVAHLTRRGRDTDGSEVRTGLTAIFTRPSTAQQMRPAAAVTAGGMVDLTGLCVLDDFGFTMSPIVATSLRAVGRVHDAMVVRRFSMNLGWPPVIAGFDDGRLSASREAPFTEDEVAQALGGATAAPVEEGAVGAGAGLAAFGFKSGIGSASRVFEAGARTFTVGALALLNLGRPDALRIQGGQARPGNGREPLQGSALAVVVTDAPLDDRQCRQVAGAALTGLGRLGAAPGSRDALIAIGVSTGVLLDRSGRAEPSIDVPFAPATVGHAAAAAIDAAEEAAVRSLTQVAVQDAAADYPVFRRRA